MIIISIKKMNILHNYYLPNPNNSNSICIFCCAYLTEKNIKRHIEDQHKDILLSLENDDPKSSHYVCLCKQKASKALDLIMENEMKQLQQEELINYDVQVSTDQISVESDLPPPIPSKMNESSIIYPGLDYSGLPPPPPIPSKRIESPIVYPALDYSGLPPPIPIPVPKQPNIQQQLFQQSLIPQKQLICSSNQQFIQPNYSLADNSGYIQLYTSSQETKQMDNVNAKRKRIEDKQLTRISEQIKMEVAKLNVKYNIPFDNSVVFKDFYCSVFEFIEPYDNDGCFKDIKAKLGELDGKPIRERVVELGKCIKNINIKKIKESLGYVIQFDETTDVSGKSKTVIIGRFLTFNNNSIQISNVFLGIVSNKLNHIGSDDIIQSIESRLGSFDQQTLLRGVTTDGPNSMLLLRRKLKYKFTKRKSILLDWTCGLHSLNNIAKEIDDLGVIDGVIKFIQYINSSPKRAQELADILKKEYGVEMILEFSDMRWLSKGKTLVRISKTIKKCVEYMNGKVIELFCGKKFSLNEIKKYDEKIFDTLKKCVEREEKQKRRKERRKRKTRKNWKIEVEKIETKKGKIKKMKPVYVGNKKDDEEKEESKQFKKYGKYPFILFLFENTEYQKDLFFLTDLISLINRISKYSQSQSITIIDFQYIVAYLLLQLEQMIESLNSDDWKTNDLFSTLQYLIINNIELTSSDKKRFIDVIEDFCFKCERKYESLFVFEKIMEMIDYNKYSDEIIECILNEFICFDIVDEEDEKKSRKRKKDSETMKDLDENQTIINEMKQQMKKELETLQNESIEKNERRNIILSNQNVYSLLYELLTGVLLLFPTTCASESVFSILKYVKNQYRNRLGDDLLESSLAIRFAGDSEIKEAQNEYLKSHEYLRSDEHRKSVRKNANFNL